MKIIIKFFPNFYDSKFCKKIAEITWDTININNYGINNDIYITDDDNYTHAIILNTAMPKLNIPKENVIGLAYEPNEFLNINNLFLDYAKNHISKYFIGYKGNLPEPFIETYAYLWHMKPLLYTPNKNKLMSLIVSQKKDAPGHKYRHQIVKKILETNLPIDIWGRGYIFYENLNDKRIKGEFNNDEPVEFFNSLEPYEEYKFHICIENFQLNDYISEKVINPLVASCTPIYLGAKNINKYFQNDIILLSGDIDNDFELIKNIIDNPDKYVKSINVEQINNKINLIKNINTMFN